MDSDIIIVGGGAAGMVAAYAAAKSGASVTVLEKMSRPGRKIMISGKGRCNMTNLKDWNEFSEHIHPKAAFLKNAFYNFSSADTLEFFRENGLETVVERGDRVFPASYKASDVVDTLLSAAKKAGASVMTGSEVSGIFRDDGIFTLDLVSGKRMTAAKIIIATGGLSYPATGSTGDGYRWAACFGHKIRHCFPSLTALVPADYKVSGGIPQGRGHISRDLPPSELGKTLMGNQLKNISLTVNIDGHTVTEEFGDADFTDGGLEGPAGFRISRKCVNALENGSKVTVRSVDNPVSPRVESKTSEKREDVIMMDNATVMNSFLIRHSLRRSRYSCHTHPALYSAGSPSRLPALQPYLHDGLQLQEP